jgi:ADP-heptose:LPS heptosyltransferase
MDLASGCGSGEPCPGVFFPAKPLMNLTSRLPTTSTNETLRNRVAEVCGLIAAEARPRPVIVVFGLGSYGDVIQITPLLHALHGRFPQAALILVHHDALGAKLVESAPYLAKFIRLRSSAHYLLRSSLEETSCDLLVECRYVIKYTLSTGSRFSPADLHFVREAQEVQKPWLKFVQNFPFDNDLLWRQAKTKGWSMYDLMAHTAGFPDEDFECLRVHLPPGRSGLADLSLPPRYVVVSNSAEWLSLQSSLWTKSLPHARMKEVLRELQARAIPTVLLGTANDPGLYPVDHDLRGRTHLLEAADIVRQARAVLGPEGGLVNLARAVGTPSVVFFGSTPVDFFRFKNNVNIAPRFCGGCWWTTESYLRQCPLLEKTPPCTDSLDIGEIVRHVERLYRSET